MLTYRATLRPRSATLSPWQADTLFGHLCWLTLYRDGEPALEKFLAEYGDQKTPPLLFSNGFPGDWLPRPLLPAQPPPAERQKAVQVRAMQEAKAAKGVRWVSLDEFNALRRGERFELRPRPGLDSDRPVLKNQINRLTFGTTPQEEDAGGNLYSVEELAFARKEGRRRSGLDISLYVKARDETWAAKAGDLLEMLAQGGYGAKKSAGYGHFELAGWERFAAFDDPVPDANGFISLSNWVPARADPLRGFYAPMVKYGKLGEELANAENPFKFPLIMLGAGSAFYAGGSLREWYGRLVPGVAPADGRVVQYGYAFAVPARLAPEAA